MSVKKQNDASLSSTELAHKIASQAVSHQARQVLELWERLTIDLLGELKVEDPEQLFNLYMLRRTDEDFQRILMLQQDPNNPSRMVHIPKRNYEPLGHEAVDAILLALKDMKASVPKMRQLDDRSSVQPIQSLLDLEREDQGKDPPMVPEVANDRKKRVNGNRDSLKKLYFFVTIAYVVIMLVAAFLGGSVFNYAFWFLAGAFPILSIVAAVKILRKLTRR